jgi:tyrosyl-tRNA synthetase
MDKYTRQAEFLARGTEILPGGVEALAKKLKKAEEDKKPLRVKLGLDPTKPDLHLGHTVVMRKLRQYQVLGHQVVLIIGDATAMIGDPSGRSETRKSLTREEVEQNAQTYLDQFNKIIDVSKAEVVYNGKWLFELNVEGLLTLSSKVTVAQMLARDDFSKRYADGRPISIHEFFYPLMQAYDSVAIKSDIELGGTDQRFNVLMAREIQIAYEVSPQIVQLLPLLEGTDGVVKMSKTYPEHCISLTEPPKEMYGKIMSIPDSLIVRYFSLLTDISNEQIEEYDKKLKEGNENPRDYKMTLARMLVSEYYSPDEAKIAEEEFVKVFSRKELPDDMPEIKVYDGVSIVDLVVNINFASSKGEVKRLIQGGGVKINTEKVNDIKDVLKFNGNESLVLQVGKRKFARLIPE